MTNIIDLTSLPLDAVREVLQAKNIFATIKLLLANQDYTRAFMEFAQHLDFLCSNFTINELQELLSRAPIAVAQSDANYLYCRGMVCERDNQLTLAVDYLKEAKQAYWHQDRKESAIRCTLEIARSYHRQEDFRLANCYLADEAQSLLDEFSTIDPELHALFLLNMANLAIDIGKFYASQAYAEKALQLYVGQGDLYGQFRAQLRIGRNYVQTGTYVEANRHLQLARQYFHIGKFTTAAEGLLLNAEIHLRWYQGQLDEALYLAGLYLKIADHNKLHNAMVYARILLGNLYRDQENFVMAARWYDETQELLTAQQYQLYQPWLDAQRTWLLIREGQLVKAQDLCTKSLITTDWGQRMSFQVQQAVLHLTKGKASSAELLLLESLDYYQTSGDSLACCMIRLYLAYAAMHTQNTGNILVHLDHAFAWLNEHNIEVLPYWWNPEIVAEVCQQAIAIDLYPDTVRQICINRLGSHVVSPLTKLLRSDDVDVRHRAHQMINVVTGQAMTILSHLPDGPAKTVLQELLDEGYLLADGFPRLEAALMTARQRQHPNPTLISVFALYTLGHDREAIATRLNCSVENVRNYVTIIYQKYALPAKEFDSRIARRQHLAQIARQQGYLR